MRKYVSPKIEIIEFEAEDIIRTSGEENVPLTLESEPITVEGGDSTIFELS